MDLVAFATFRTRHTLSLAQLLDLCRATPAAGQLPRKAGVSRTTLHRFVNDTLTPDYAALLQPVVRAAVTRFARTLAAPPSVVVAEMQTIFSDFTEGELLMFSTRTALSRAAQCHFGLRDARGASVEVAVTACKSFASSAAS